MPFAQTLPAVIEVGISVLASVTEPLSSPQIKNDLSAEKLALFSPLELEIVSRPMATTFPVLVVLTDLDCFCFSPEQSSRPIPVILYLKALFDVAFQIVAPVPST